MGTGYPSAVLTVATSLDPASVAPVVLTYATGSGLAQLNLPSSVSGHTYQLQRT